MGDAVGNNGTGPPETLAITAGGANIAMLSMPPHMAFGIAAVLRDAAGQVIAIIATAETQRPSGWSKQHTVQIWGTKPIAGKSAVTVGGVPCYLWGSAEGKRLSNHWTFFKASEGGSSTVYAKGSPINGSAWQYKFETAGGDGPPAGQGLMLASARHGMLEPPSEPGAFATAPLVCALAQRSEMLTPSPHVISTAACAAFTPGSNKKQFDIQCAEGVDTAFALCMMAAMQLGKDELKVDPSQSTTDGPGDD